MAINKHVVFDVIGTCVSFDAFYNGIDKVIGDKIRPYNITANHFGYTWMTAAELEFTFLSISESYRPYKDVLKALFYRSLSMAGIPNPKTLITDAERDQCVEAYSMLEIRPGTEECFQKLRGKGFTVWCLSTGDAKRVRGYFERANVDMPPENIISCDTKGVAKPALAAYTPALDRFESQDVKWFAAAHMWDVSAAVKTGFRGAYCTVYEKEFSSEIFDSTMDVVADTLPEMADKIIEAS